MIRGYYASASSLAALLRRQEVLSHNLANVNTPGFKQEMTLFETPDEAGLMAESQAQVLPGIGPLPTGVDGAVSTVDFAQGPLTNTGQPWDLAITGDGFFRVQTPQGERLTRDGTFRRDSSGHLVTTDGYFVLGTNGPIQVGEGVPAVMEDGAIYVGNTNQPAGRIDIVTVTDPQQLQREGQNLFNAGNAAVQRAQPGTTSVRQAMLEGANVDLSGSMVTMMMVLRSYEAVQRSMKLQDETLQRTMDIGRLG